MKTIIALGILALTGTAFAKGGPKGGTPQTHHCQTKDGSEAMKTKKECLKDGGTWANGAPGGAAAGGAATPAPAPAPKAK